MTALSDYLEGMVIDWLRNNSPASPPTTLYLALYTTATDDAGGGTEVTGGSYARQTITLADDTTPGRYLSR